MSAAARERESKMGRITQIKCSCAIALAWVAPAFAQPADNVQPDSAEEAEENDPSVIIVTATRRETSLQETPAAVSVVGGEEIEKRNLVGMDDYLASIPGVAYSDRGAGSNTITIRGITTGSQLSPNTPTGSYFGEVPVTGLGPQVNGNQAGNADIKMVDVARVEILRGPQGTLFGSGALGGAVRVIPNAPDLDEFGGNAVVEYSNTARRGSHNYSLQGVVNLPIVEDRLALRLVGYRYFNDGFIDNVAGSQPTPTITAAAALGVPVRDRENVGAETTTGARASILWQPIEGLSITAMHLYQRLEQDGLAGIELGLSPTDYLQARPRTGPAGNSDEFVDMSLHLSNIVAEYGWSWGSILNSTAWIDSQGESEISLNFFDPLIPGSPLFLGVYAPGRNDKETFVNETRFTSEWDFPVQVIAGLFYANRRDSVDASLVYNGTPPPPPTIIVANGPRRTLQTKQIAAFGEMAFTPWEPFTLTVGGRYFNFEQSYPLFLDSTDPVIPSALQGVEETIDGFNWKVNAAFELNEEWFLYAQWAQGFREPQFQGVLDDAVYDPDGNGLYDFQDGTERRPQEGLLDPDRVDTYEAGVKWQSASGNVSGSLTGYYTDWTGIPISLLTVPTGAAFFFNAGKAVSKGIEFELSGRLPDNWYAQFSASWSEATLGNDPDSRSLAGGRANADLPGSPDHNAYASLEKRFDLGGNEAFVRGDWTYVGQYFSTLIQTGRAGDYHFFGASAGVMIDNFKLGVFAKNLTNRNDIIHIDNVLASGRAYRLRPRTIGINVGVEF
jgi:iron complex outermembrane recepter protein